MFSTILLVVRVLQFILAIIELALAGSGTFACEVNQASLSHQPLFCTISHRFTNYSNSLPLVLDLLAILGLGLLSRFLWFPPGPRILANPSQLHGIQRRRDTHCCILPVYTLALLRSERESNGYHEDSLWACELRCVSSGCYQRHTMAGRIRRHRFIPF